MKNHFAKVVLPAAIIAARMSCQAQQVYSQGLADSFVSAAHRPDEIQITSYDYAASNETARVEWYVSTNLLAKQPRWDGLSAEAPLSIRKACVLALQPVHERFPEVQSWVVKSVSLSNPYPDDPDHPAEEKADQNIWYYQIVLTPHDLQVRARLEQRASAVSEMQIVLLDGTVVPPRLLKKK
jgi:hypothetical protein